MDSCLRSGMTLQPFVPKTRCEVKPEEPLKFAISVIRRTTTSPVETYRGGRRLRLAVDVTLLTQGPVYELN